MKIKNFAMACVFGALTFGSSAFAASKQSVSVIWAESAFIPYVTSADAVVNQAGPFTTRQIVGKIIQGGTANGMVTLAAHNSVGLWIIGTHKSAGLNYCANANTDTSFSPRDGQLKVIITGYNSENHSLVCTQE